MKHHFYIQGDRSSDKFTTEDCGVLRNLEYDDIVLPNRSFLITESVGLCCANLYIPPFTKGNHQLSARKVEHTRELANVLAIEEHRSTKFQLYAVHGTIYATLWSQWVSLCSLYAIVLFAHLNADAGKTRTHFCQLPFSPESCVTGTLHLKCL